MNLLRLPLLRFPVLAGLLIAGIAAHSPASAKQEVVLIGGKVELSKSLTVALMGQLESCWNVADLTRHSDASKMRARASFKLTKSGDLDGPVSVQVSGADKVTLLILAEGVRAAVTNCAPYQLPQESYDTWKDVVVNFSLASMQKIMGTNQ